MTKVKVCGMMRPEDVDMASGADYVGFVVNAGTRRSLNIDRARELMSLCARPRVVVSTFTDADALVGLVSSLEPEVLQISAPVDTVTLKKVRRSIGCQLWAAVHIGRGDEKERLSLVKENVDAVLLDTYSKQGGGVGLAHDWNASARLKRAVSPMPIILAGGLDSDNVEYAVRTVGPFAVDVSSGVEINGAKDPERVKKFIKAVRRCL